jgi:hypothetical protein
MQSSPLLSHASPTAVLAYRGGRAIGRMVRCIRDGAARLGVLDGRAHTLIGTMPAQHIYGFESTVLLAAAVVAPGLSAATVIESLRQRIDPVFLPRPLLIAERLLRNATGKLPQQALQSLATKVSR